MTDILELLSIKDQVFTESLGVGTLTPSELGHIDADTGTDAFLKLEMGTGNSGANLSGIKYANSVGTNIFQTIFDNATEQFIIESDITSDAFVVTRAGNLGIGTTTPGTLLELSATSSYDLTNGGPNSGAIQIAGGTVGLGNLTGGISFNMAGGGSAGLAGKQGQAADSDVMGLVFITHDSSVGTNSSIESMELRATGELIIAENGSAISPALRIGGEANTGLYLPTANELGISTAGIERVKISSNGDTIFNANVGINETSPDGLVHIVGSSSDSQLKLQRTGTATAEAWIWANSDKLRFGTDSAGAPNETLMAIETDTGNVGVGTTTPTNNLEVRSTSDTNLQVAKTGQSSLTMLCGDSGAATFQAGGVGGGTLIFSTDSTERMRISSAGNVGIGTTTPENNARLHSYSTGVTVRNIIESSLTNGYPILKLANGSGNWELILDGTSQDFRILDDSTERLRITNNGDLGVGTDNPVARLHVERNDQRLVFSDNANRPFLDLVRNTTSISDGQQVALLRFRAKDDAGNETTYGFIRATAIDVTNGSEDGSLEFFTTVNAVSTETMTLNAGKVGIGYDNPVNKLTISGANYDLTNGGRLSGGIDLSGDSTGSGKFSAGVAFRMSTSNSGAAGMTGVQFGTDSDRVGLAFFTHPSTAGTDPAVQQFLIDPDGNVGIGESSPQAKLHVAGNATLETTAGIDIDFRFREAGVNKWNFAYDASAGAMTLYNNTLGSSSMFWASNNNVGIGTTTPDGKLHVYNGSAGAFTPSVNADEVVVENSANAGITILTPDNNFSALQFASPTIVGASLNWNYSSKTLKLGTLATDSEFIIATSNNIEAVRIDGSGNVGIGDTTPDVPLSIVGSNFDIAGDSSSSNGITLAGDVAGDGNFSAGIAFKMAPEDRDGVSGIAGVQEGTDGDRIGIAFFTHPSVSGPVDLVEQMRLDPDGDLGMGTITPALGGGDSGRVLHLQSGDRACLRLERTSGGGDLDIRAYAGSGAQIINRASGDLKLGTNAVTAITINSSGDVGLGKDTPLTKLHIADSSDPTIRLDRNSGTGHADISSDSVGNLTLDADAAATATGDQSVLLKVSGTTVLNVNPTTTAIESGQLRIDTANTPASASATGTTGTISWDSNYLYVCVATDAWKRAALSTW